MSLSKSGIFNTPKSSKTKTDITRTLKEQHLGKALSGLLTLFHKYFIFNYESVIRDEKYFFNWG